MRECPRCGNECLFNTADGLETEHEVMRDLSKRLSQIPKTNDPSLLEEARDIIHKLKKSNLRWNIQELQDFLNERQRELFLS